MTFEEWQPLRQQPAAFLALLAAAVAVGAAAWSTQGPDRWAAVAGGVVILLLLVVAGLRTRVGPDEVVLTWIPLWRRRIRRVDIEAVDVVTVRPLWEFGGWGIRLGRCGILYNVRGNQAVRLQVAGKRDLFIGTQDPEALEAALRL